MKRLLICLVALIAVFALVMPTYASEMKVSGIWNAKPIHRDNYDGDDDRDDSTSYVTQRFRSYWHFIASENLKLVYKNEIDIEWGDNDEVVTDTAGNKHSRAAGRNSGGGVGGDRVNMETKNIYLEFMVPDTPVKATLGLQGVTLHKGWFISEDVSAARFDMNFDPISITTYWAGLKGLEAEDTDASNDNWQIVASGAYKAENMDARFTLGYERKPNERTNGAFDTGSPVSKNNPGPATLAAGTDDNDLFLAMGEFNMSFDMFSFFVIAGTNFGEADGTGVATANNRDYSGYMFNAGADFALDMATLRGQFIYTSGDKEGDFDDDYQGMSGATFSWAEIISDGYSYDRNAVLAQIGGDKSPSNMWAVNVGADLKPTDTTTITFDAYYIGMSEDRTVAGKKEDEIGIEVDARLTQKIYDSLSLTLLGAYMFAEDGYGLYDADSKTVGIQQAANSGDDAFHLGLGLDYKF